MRGDVGMLGDVPSDYSAPYSGVVMAPYAKGPLGALPLFGKPLARAQFLTWLKDFNPALFEAAVKRAEDWKAGLKSPTALSGVSSLGQDDSTSTAAPAASSWWQQLATAASSLGTAYLAYKGQQNVLATNIQRAQMGLPPIDPSTGAPTIRTSVSLSPQLMSRLSDSGSWLLIGAVGLGAFFLLSNFMRGRRR